MRPSGSHTTSSWTTKRISTRLPMQFSKPSRTSKNSAGSSTQLSALRNSAVPTGRAEIGQVGYAVVGLGAISQQAVLPAFAHSNNARLVGVVSGDKDKAKRLARQFRAKAYYSYDEYAQCLKNPEVEAVYVATPPGEHEKYTVRAARANKHVLCEKP